MPGNQDSPLKTYLDHLSRAELAYQFSPDASKPVFYPRVICPYTGHDNLEWRISQGLGTVHATQHRVFHSVRRIGNDGEQFAVITQQSVPSLKTCRRAEYWEDM